MACTAKLTVTVTGDRISFVAVCEGVCDKTKEACIPVIDGLNSNDKRYELTHLGSGRREADAQINITNDITNANPVTIRALCTCGDNISIDPYVINEHHPETTAKDVVLAIITLGKLFGALRP